MDTIFVIMRPDGTPFHRDDAMGILATDSEAQAIRLQHTREDEGAEYVRYTRAQPPSAASVSERARDDRFTAMLIGIIADVQDALGFTDEDKECSNGSLEIVAAIRELKEQALTQQRGEAVARVIFTNRKKPDVEWLTDTVKRDTLLYATPQPSADAVRELVKRWRDQDARKHSAPGDRSDCADELESLLSVASDHQQNAAQGGGE